MKELVYALKDKNYLFLSSDDGSVMRFIPLSVWCSIDLYNCVFNECVCSYQFVIGCVVYDVHDFCLFRCCFTSPTEISGIES